MEFRSRGGFQQGDQGMQCLRWQRFALAALLTAGLLSGVYSNTSAQSHRAQANRMSDVEQILKHAAVKSPNWHSKQASIQRDVHDIGYLLEQAYKAAQSGNGAATQDYARQALALLQRAVSRGHFLPEDIAPIRDEIRRLIPNPPV